MKLMQFQHLSLRLIMLPQLFACSRDSNDRPTTGVSDPNTVNVSANVESVA